MYFLYREFRKTHSNEVDFTYEFTSQAIQTFSHVSEGAYPDPETKKWPDNSIQYERVKWGLEAAPRKKM